MRGLFPVPAVPGSRSLFDPSKPDIRAVGGTWSTVPAVAPPRPIGSSVVRFGDVVQIPSASSLADPTAAAAFMLELAGMLNVRTTSFAQASRDQTENWIRDANDGQTDVQPRTVALSARAD